MKRRVGTFAKVDNPGKNETFGGVVAATNPDCEVCGQNHPFELPPKLLQAALAKKLVVFAGTGISTESRQVFPDTFAKGIAAELRGSGEGLNFPELMSAYEERFGRGELHEDLTCARIGSKLGLTWQADG